VSVLLIDSSLLVSVAISLPEQVIPKARSSLFIGQNLWARNFALANNQPFNGQTLTHASAAASRDGANGQPLMPPQPPQPPAMDLLGRGDPLHSAAVWARRRAQDSLRGRSPLHIWRPSADTSVMGTA